MKWKKPNSKKSKAQAMVEFAIALPVLLLLLYGIIEAGRLLFIYSTVVTASRQAVRYGSATGTGNGTGNVNEPRYQDCDGIRNAAQAVGYLGAFNTITIKHDDGPSDPSPQQFCVNPADTTDITLWTPNANNTSRISVTVEKQYSPIVKLVPFAARTIKATSSRTILLSVSIQVTSPPVTFIASTPTPTITPSPSPTNTATATSTRTPTPTAVFTFTPSRTPTSTLVPTNTLIPTITRTPTIAASPVASCTGITHGPITTLGNTMNMTITNPFGFPLTLDTTTITWNNDKGHQFGGDKTLKLQSVSLGGTPFWTGTNDGPTYTITASPVIAANSTITISFTFHQSYDNSEATDAISITLSTPGCETVVISS